MEGDIPLEHKLSSIREYDAKHIASPGAGEVRRTRHCPPSVSPIPSIGGNCKRDVVSDRRKVFPDPILEPIFAEKKENKKQSGKETLQKCIPTCFANSDFNSGPKVGVAANIARAKDRARKLVGEIPMPRGAPLPHGEGSIPLEVIPVPNPIIVRFEGGKPMEVADLDSPKKTKREFTIIVTPIKHCRWKDNTNFNEIEASGTQAHFS